MYSFKHRQVSFICPLKIKERVTYSLNPLAHLVPFQKRQSTVTGIRQQSLVTGHQSLSIGHQEPGTRNWSPLTGNRSMSMDLRPTGTCHKTPGTLTFSPVTSHRSSGHSHWAPVFRRYRIQLVTVFSEKTDTQSLPAL